EGLAGRHQDPLDHPLARGDDLETRLDQHRVGQRLPGIDAIAFGYPPAVEQRLGRRIDVGPGRIGKPGLGHAATASRSLAEQVARAASTIACTCGMTACSSGRLYGIGTSGTASLRTGAR